MENKLREIIRNESENFFGILDKKRVEYKVVDSVKNLYSTIWGFRIISDDELKEDFRAVVIYDHRTSGSGCDFVYLYNYHIIPIDRKIEDLVDIELFNFRTKDMGFSRNVTNNHINFYQCR